MSFSPFVKMFSIIILSFYRVPIFWPRSRLLQFAVCVGKGLRYPAFHKPQAYYAGY